MLDGLFHSAHRGRDAWEERNLGLNLGPGKVTWRRLGLLDHIGIVSSMNSLVPSRDRSIAKDLKTLLMFIVFYASVNSHMYLKG